MLRPKAERRLRTAPWMLHTLLEALAAQPDVALRTRASISRPPICSRSLDDWCGAPYGRAVSPSVPGARMP